MVLTITRQVSVSTGCAVWKPSCTCAVDDTSCVVLSPQETCLISVVAELAASMTSGIQFECGQEQSVLYQRMQL